MSRQLIEPRPVEFLEEPFVSNRITGDAHADEIFFHPAIVVQEGIFDRLEFEITGGLPVIPPSAKAGFALYDAEGQLITKSESNGLGNTAGLKSISFDEEVWVAPGLHYIAFTIDTTAVIFRGITLPNPSSGGLAWRWGIHGSDTGPTFNSTIDVSDVSESGAAQPFLSFQYTGVSP